MADKACCSKVSIAAGPDYWAVLFFKALCRQFGVIKKSFGNLWEFSLSNMEDGYLPQALRFTLMLKLPGGSSPPNIGIMEKKMETTTMSYIGDYKVYIWVIYGFIGIMPKPQLP